MVSSEAVAQVKAWMTPIGSPEIQQLRGAAHDGRRPIFFSLMHYTAAAMAFADQAGVALFQFEGYDGTIKPVNAVAEHLLVQRERARKRPRPVDPRTGVFTRRGKRVMSREVSQLRSRPAAFELITTLVRDALQAIPETGGFAVIEAIESGRYVAFSKRRAGEGGAPDGLLGTTGLIGATSSQTSVVSHGNGDRIVDEEARSLTELGWNPPDREGEPWNRRWPTEELCLAVEVAAKTLATAYGAGGPAQLKVHTSDPKAVVVRRRPR